MHEWDRHRWNTDKLDGDFNVDANVPDGITISRGARSPYLPFGASRHRCIGEKFAYLNLRAIVATLLRQFRFYSLSQDGKLPETDYTSMFSTPLQPAVIRCQRREVKR